MIRRSSWAGFVKVAPVVQPHIINACIGWPYRKTRFMHTYMTSLITCQNFLGWSWDINPLPGQILAMVNDLVCSRWVKIRYLIKLLIHMGKYAIQRTFGIYSGRNMAILTVFLERIRVWDIWIGIYQSRCWYGIVYTIRRVNCSTCSMYTRQSSSFELMFCVE